MRVLLRGTSCRVGAGHGLVTPTGAGALAPVLQEVELPLIDSLTCSALLRAMDLPPVQGSMLCAGFPDGGRDACKVRAPPGRLLLGSRPGLSVCKPLPAWGEREAAALMCCQHSAEQELSKELQDNKGRRDLLMVGVGEWAGG